MSLDATTWAWKAPVETSSQRVVLLSMADRAGEDHTAYPSVARLAKDCVLNRKTVMKVADQLEELGLLQDTGKTRGNGVKVYRLIGVNGREEIPLTSTKSGTCPKNGTSTKSGTATCTKSGTATSPKSGTQNLPMNLLIESKNKKTWFSWKKLEDELDYLQAPNLISEIKNASWFERELNHFEKFNANKNLTDDVMIYHFADKLVQAVAKYRALESKSNPVQNKKSSSEKPKQARTADQDQQAPVEKPKANGKPPLLSYKQVGLFAKLLAEYDPFASKHAEPGEQTKDLEKRLRMKLGSPDYALSILKHLQAVGYVNYGLVS
ncbi:helix-turn-helix domain-containing protein [Acinetobacter sp. HY1485]|uniref:helix-turn-helix domain-containing protein n=1 Tax=Acinetobacter sp. HY1485 TaxID=2970918 RepID=UPI0022B9422B|nr:helix-turn-helix domain-containing protein [Acinetobacter sp. HY1485]